MACHYGSGLPIRRDPVRPFRSGREASVTVAVRPPDGNNRVELRYRVNQGPTKAVSAQWMRHSASEAHYFKAVFPKLTAGDVVDYSIVCRCAGRQAPSAEEATQFAATFRVVEAGTSVTPEVPSKDRALKRAGGALGGYAPPVKKDSQNYTAKASACVVRGQVRANGHPLTNVTVRAYDKDLPSLGSRSEQQIGDEDITDADGSYCISYPTDQFRRGESRRRKKLQPDLMIRVFDGDALLGESKILFNAPPDASIDLTVERPERSEYDCLASRLRPVLQGVALADLTDQDLDFLASEAEIEPERLKLLRQSAQFARQASLPAEVFYAWGRINQRPFTLEELAALPDKDLHVALTEAVTQKIAPAALSDRIDPIIHALKRVGYVAHQATARLLDRNSGVGLAGFRVRVLDRSAGARPGDLGPFVTDRNGTFSFDYMAPPAGQRTAEAGLQFRLNVTTPKGVTLPDSNITVQPSQSDVIQVRIEMPAAAPPSPTIEEVAKASAGAIPDALVFFLRQHNIITLRDIGRVGDLAKIAGTPATADRSTRTREAHEDPSRSSENIHVNQSRIPKAFTGLAAFNDALTSLLHRREVKTPTDVGTPTGVGHVRDLANGASTPVAVDHSPLEFLAAHADLSRLSTDVHVNTSLIQNGFKSVAAIADTPRSTFVSLMHDTFGDFKAARMHAVARAQTAFLDNVLAGMATVQKTVAGAQDESGGIGLPAQPCTCADCESAISPALYLADLLRYATTHIQHDSQIVNLQFLVDTFHQPFDGLKVSCEAVNQQVRTARICVEILRAHLGPRPLKDSQKESGLQNIELEYLTKAYTLLLNQIGTSYDEIRFARTDIDDNRKSLTERLGIELTSARPDELDRLFLEFPATVGNPATLDQLRILERQLEQLFGLVDTRKDPLSDGAKFGDDNNPQIRRWNLRGAEWGRNTDPDGNVYVTVEILDPTTFDVKLFRDTQRAQLVAASGVKAAVAQEVLLLPKNGSDLSGSFDVPGCALPTPSSNISLSLIPNFLSWRLKHLRTSWKQEDRPPDLYALGTLPLIDPDLIGPDDFRLPIPKASAGAPNTTAFDLWLTRRGFIDTTLSSLQHDREATADGLTVILKEVFNPLPNFDSLLQDLTQGNKDQVKAATDAVLKLNMAVDSFTRLMEIRDKDAQSRARQGDPVRPDEWREVYSILTQVKKVRLFDPQLPNNWLQQEQQLKIVLGMQDFWVSLREPVVGDWPPAQVVTAPQTAITPLIDPDLQTLKDLPEPVAGKLAIDFWNARLTQLKGTLATLASTRESSGFEAMLEFALGKPLPHDLDQLRKDLASGNLAVVAAAKDAITNDLHLTIEAFARMMAIRDKDKDGQTDPGKKPTAAEYAEVCALLTKAWKIRVAYPQWINEENTAFTAEGQTAGDPSVAYWRARKAALPRWRASAEGRQIWQQALTARSQQPVIDPDLIDAYDLRDPIPQNAAYQLWQGRSKDVTSRISTVTKTPPKTKGDLDTLFQNQGYLGLVTGDLFALDKERSLGHSLRGRLDQLGLTNGAFDALLRVSNLVVNGAPVLPSEWVNVASILVQSFKKKQFAAWRLEEQGSGIILGADLFQVRPTSTDPLSPIPDPALPPWRATFAARRNWQDTLQARIDEQNSTIDGTRAAVNATEAATFQILRDGLIMAAAAAGGSDLDRAADWVTKRFLIGAKMDSSQTTTRVEQAIETLQSLLLALSEEQFDLNRFELAAGAAVVKAADGIHLFARDFDNMLWHTSIAGAVWQDWESLGDVITSDPAACMRDGKLELFALRYDDAVWRKTLDNGVWSDWTSLGGVWSSAPAAVSWRGDHLEVVVRGTDWHIYHNRLENDQWSGWQDLGGILSSGPTISSRGVQQLEVFALGLDSAIWYLIFNQNWQTWQRLGGTWKSVPAAVSPHDSSGTTSISNVYVRGTDDLLYLWPFITNFTTVPSSIPGVLLTSSPGVCIAATMGIPPFTTFLEAVFVRGSDRRLWQRFQGSWTPIGPAPLTLNDPSFEETWKWLGRYAKWRAAMLVSLYPDSLLLPTLRAPDRITPAFQRMVKTLSQDNNTTAATVCQAVQDYSTYFQDVCSPIVDATCQTFTIQLSSECQSNGITEGRYLFYMFARGGKTNRLYWSTYDPKLAKVNKDYAQSFWTEIPSSSTQSAVKVFAAVPYRTTAGKRYICLFVQTHEANQRKLMLYRFDLDTEQWLTEQELKLPFKPFGFTAVAKQDDHETTPYIILRAEDGQEYEAWLNGEATDWGGDPQPFEKQLGQTLGMMWRDVRSIGHHFEDILSYTSLGVSEPQPQHLSFVWDPEDVNASPPELTDASYQGIVWLPLKAGMPPLSSFVHRALFVLADVQNFSRIYSNLLPATGVYPGTGDIDSIVPTAGFIPSDTNRQFVYRLGSHSIVGQPQLAGIGVIPLPPPVPGPPPVATPPHFFRCTFSWSEQGLSMATDELIVPGLDGPFDIPLKLSPQDLQLRREQIQKVFVDNKGAPASLMTPVEEAYFYVPLHVALQLQRSGQYEAALALFRTFYDYTAPKGDDRKIYYGLKLEESGAETFKRPDNWLSEPLNPHAIAETRGNTYTRYTLLCIVRCLLDYADSEFSQDTAESIARARNLYQTALDLLDTDVFKAHTEDCDVLTGVLNTSLAASVSSDAQVARLKTRLRNVSERDRLRDAVVRIQQAMESHRPPDERFVQADRVAEQAAAGSPRPVISEVLSQSQDLRRELYLSVTRKQSIDTAVQAVGVAASADFTHAVANVTNLTLERLESEPITLPWLCVTSNTKSH